MKIIFAKKNLFFYYFFLLLMNISAQETEIQTNPVSEYHHAVKLFNNKAYAAAQQLFIKVSKASDDRQNLQADADYYDAMCAVKLSQTNADKKVLAFVENHPNSNKKQLAYFNVANYYFANRKASHALKWYTKVDEKLLGLKDRDDLNFKTGYSMLVSGYYDDAKKRFLKLLSFKL